jgi:hypothetical protein
MVSKTINPNIGSYRAINTDHDVSGAGQDVAIVKESEAQDRIWVLDAIQYSYKQDDSPASGLLAAPVSGGLTIKVGNDTKVDIDIFNLSDSLNLYIPGQTDKPTTVTLKSGGSGVVGKLNVSGTWSRRNKTNVKV